VVHLIFLFVALSIGIGLKQAKVAGKDAHTVLNNVILYVCLPATSLVYTTTAHFEARYWLAVLMPWLLYIGSFVFFRWVLPRFVRLHPHTEAVLLITAGIPSISFVGFPIFEMLYGTEGLRIGVLMSQAGSFLVCGTLGVITASVYAAEQPSFIKITKDVITFPTFIAFCVAVVLNIFNIGIADILLQILKKLSAPFSLLALISVGLQIELNYKSLQINHLKFGLLYKLIVCPAIIYVLYFLFFGQHDITAQACLLGSGLGSMNMAAVVALRYNLNPTLAAQMVGISIPLSLITIGTIYFLI
jgi:malate permease and related proteins